MKNDTMYSLFNDNNFMFSSLVDLINDETKRIVQASLVDKKDLDALLTPAIKQAVNDNSMDNKLLTLSQIHTTLKNIKLPNDFKKLAGSIEIEITTNNMGYSLRPMDVLSISQESKDACCNNCSEGKECCASVVEDNTMSKQSNEKIFNKLEKIAY